VESFQAASRILLEETEKTDKEEGTESTRRCSNLPSTTESEALLLAPRNV
jgi:hypothetical protein